jgi:CheY-like chemotaxis protein
MPGKSGLLFYRQMKADPDLRGIPVIIVSGLLDKDPDWDSLIHSFLDVDHLPHPEAYLTKPVDREKVTELLGEIFGEHRQPA